MQIVVKLAKTTGSEAKKVLTGLMRGTLSEAEAARASVEPVFPGVKQGRRAGMLVLSLDDGTSPETVARVLDSLRDSGEVEYAEPSAPRKGLAPSRHRR